MSHITKIATQIRDLEALGEVLTELGLTLEIGETTVADYYGSTRSCQARFRVGDYDVGLSRREDGTYQLVGDFWGVYNSRQIPALLRGEMESIAGLEYGSTHLGVHHAQDVGGRAVLKVVGQRYGVAVAKGFAARKRLRVVEERQGDQIRLRLRRY